MALNNNLGIINLVVIKVLQRLSKNQKRHLFYCFSLISVDLVGTTLFIQSEFK